MAKNPISVNTLLMAIKLEEQAAEVYTQAKAVVESPSAKKMFEHLIAKEKGHKALLVKILGKDKIFDAGAESLDAIRLALKMEEQAIEFYTRAMVGERDPETRKTLEFLAQEEEKHRQALQDEIDRDFMKEM
jgi:rubrerythrin